MSLPKVTVLFANGGLLQDIQALDGIGAIVGTGTTPGLIGVPKVVYDLPDAEQQGFTEIAEPGMFRHLKEFYAEVSGSQELHIMLVPNTMLLADMLDNTNENGAKKLLRSANGRVRLLSVYRNPPVGYTPGADFIDSDVSAALLKAKVFGEARLADLQPVRILIEGRVTAPSAPNTLEPKTTSNGFAGVVLGGSLPDGSASVGSVLGRAVKYGAEIKIGKVANGPLSLTECYVGDKLIQDVAGLAVLHGVGFISFMNHPQKAGFYIGIDRMASTDDYRLLAYGRVVDKAALIAAAVYIEDLEGEVDVDASGNIDSLELKAMEDRISQQVNVAMGQQISGFEVYINPAQDIINTDTLKAQLRVRPKGYKSFIIVDLGLTAPVIS
jgi:hypothetical protein